MKAGIITIYDFNPNYGNRLQNYAVHNILTSLNIKATTLYVEKYEDFKYKQIKWWIHKISKFSFCKNKDYWNCDYLKRKRFIKFNKTYIPSKQIKALENVSSKYDYFVVGSDQVWNPRWYDQCLMKKDAYLLKFAKPDQKVCFSPSFGASYLPEEWRIHFAEALRNFPNISVREDAGSKIVKQLTGKDAEVLIDPTLMLSKEEWMKIEAKPKDVNFNKRYILTYFLGEKTSETEQYIKKIAQDNDLVIYNLLDVKQPKLYIADPSEFIYLINHADLILTDSFHACVFSFIFGKPFQVFPRGGTDNNMMSRIETLLNKFNLQRKLYNGDTQQDIFECDYSQGYIQLKQEQEKVIDFLNRSMKIKK